MEKVSVRFPFRLMIAFLVLASSTYPPSMFSRLTYLGMAVNVVIVVLLPCLTAHQVDSLVYKGQYVRLGFLPFASS